MTAEDGMAALRLYENHRAEISLVVTDMQMPFMNGPSLISALQKLNAQTRVVVISGLDENPDPIGRNGNGLVRFLQKPYTTEQLLVILDETLHLEPNAAAA
jgi:hypothetical protein